MSQHPGRGLFLAVICISTAPPHPPEGQRREPFFVLQTPDCQLFWRRPMEHHSIEYSATKWWHPLATDASLWSLPP